MTLTDILDQFHIEYRLAGQSSHVTGAFVGVVCPYCGVGTDKFGMGLKPGRWTTTCWKCGTHGLIDSLMDLTGEPYRVVKPLVDELGIVGGVRRETVPRNHLEYPSGIGPLLGAHKRYLKGRGFDPDQIAQEWGVMGIGPGVPLQWRLFIPIHLNGEVVSWTTRSISPTNPIRYVMARPEQEKVSARTFLYAGDSTSPSSVVVVEGCFDVWRVGRGSVCCFGVSPSRSQTERLSKFARRTVCFDSEPEAQRRADSLCKRLMPFSGKTERMVLEAKDPGSAGVREIREIRAKLG